MTTESLVARPTPAPDRPGTIPTADRRIRPAVAWATVGVLFWTFQAYVLIRWLTSPYFTPVKSGPGAPPTAMKIAIVTYVVVQGIAFLAVGWLLLIKPLLRERRLTFDGALFIAFSGFYWFWDPMGNAFGLYFTYNSWIPNMGSWVNVTPGWMTPGDPGAQVPEPFLIFAFAYGTIFVPAIIGGSLLVKWVMRRWNRGMFFGLVAAFVVFFVFETLLELVWMRMGLYTYAGGIKSMTIFPNNYYGYPIYESLWAFTLTAGSYLRVSRDDRGYSIAERGLERMKFPGPKNGIRLMAIVGWLYTAILVVYFVPLWLFTLHSEAWPADVMKRSYLTDYLCGPQTHRACPADNVPLFRPKSVTITPDGKLYLPPGVPPVDQPTTFPNAANNP
jgi:hypothetical protein